MKNLSAKQRVWRICGEKGAKLISKGLAFFANKEPERYQSAEISKMEFVAGARYLHRGYYCPSLLRDVLVVNCKRGKILTRPTVKSKISHRYIYGPDKKLMIAEAALPDGKKKTEYLVYNGNLVYGFAFDDYGTLVGISEEAYESDRIKSYFCASCFEHVGDKYSIGITDFHYEEYHYNKNGLQNVDYYFSNFWSDEIHNPDELDCLIQGDKYNAAKLRGRGQ